MPAERSGPPNGPEEVALLAGVVPPGADDRLLAEIIANMFAGVALLRDGDGVFLYANPRYAEMFGYGPGELEGKPASILNAPGERTPEEVAAAIVERIKADGAWRGEIENLRKDGTRVWTSAHVTIFEHPAFGKVWVVVQLDISARKLAEAERRKSEERLELVLQATGSGAWDWNIQTGEVYFSPYWITSLGYDPKEIPPTVDSWEKLVHPDDMPRVQDALVKHFDGTTPGYECVNRLRRKDGTWRWNLDRGRVVARTADGAPLRMVGIDTDLSQQHWSGLREFVAICAGCKKIREESGQWRSLESHFQEHSLAQFTHGICPECVKKFYGDVPDVSE